MERSSRPAMKRTLARADTPTPLSMTSVRSRVVTRIHRSLIEFRRSVAQTDAQFVENAEKSSQIGIRRAEFKRLATCKCTSLSLQYQGFVLGRLPRKRRQ
jgi:hypothetical protein